MNHCIHTCRLHVLGVALGSTLAFSTAFAGQITLTFDSVPVATCWDIWTDQFCDLQFANTGLGDCLTPSCAFALGSGEVEISATIAALLFAHRGITRIEADIVEGATAGCAILKIRSASFPIGQTQSSHAGPAPETLVVDAPEGYEISSFSLSGDATTVLEIRLSGDSLVSVTTDRWGSVKARYR